MRLLRFIPMCVLVLCLFALQPAEAARAAAPSPSDAVRASVDEILRIVQNPGYADKKTRPPLRAEIEQIVRGAFDFMEFSKRTIGTYWANFNPEQQRHFAEIFGEMLLTTYLGKVHGYSGEKVTYLGERFAQNNRLAEVQTTILLSGDQATPVAYRMILKDNAWRIYDVLVENVSLNSNYRAQFQEVLAKSPPEELIRRIEKRVQELRQQDANP